VYSLGSHRYGCLGIGKLEKDISKPSLIEDLEEIVEIAANTNVSYAINKTGKVYSWGTNYSKQLGQDTEEDFYKPTIVNSKQLNVRDVYSVSIGGQHTLFIAGEEKDESDDEN
jgi:regulator of chromosome condensation